MMIKTISFDDFGMGNQRFMDLVMQLYERYDKRFKATLYTLPDFKPEFIDFLKYVKSLGFLELAQHGLFHTKMEYMQLTEQEATQKTLQGYEPFKDYFVKGFKAPYWRYSFGSLVALKKLGFWVAVLPGWQFESELKGIRYYSAEESTKDIYYFQGHMGNICNDGIEQKIDELMNLEEEGDFKFNSEMLKEF